MSNITLNQKRAYQWWNSLSKTERETLAAKYYPEYTADDITKMSPDWIEAIWQSEA